MKFHKNSLKLTGIYLAILMCISLFFSINVYQLSMNELERGLRRPAPGSILNHLPLDAPDRLRSQLQQEREDQYLLARDRIINRLVVVNSIILVAGGLLSYYFALRTLRPIEKAHAAQSRFTSDASHELRTPIAAMQAETEVALMDPKLTLSKAKDILRSNIEELAKLTALSEGLLKLAQAENTELATERTDVSDLVVQAIDRVQKTAKAKGIVIEYQNSKEIVIYVEKQSMIEAITILLDNAVKYSPQKTKVAVQISQESKHVALQVKDQGVGIEPSELPHIFDRFYRADSARYKKTADGYGIGLALAKDIVEKHMGKIEVSSTPGKGSTFTITLPA